MKLRNGSAARRGNSSTIYVDDSTAMPELSDHMTLYIDSVEVIQ